MRRNSTLMPLSHRQYALLLATAFAIVLLASGFRPLFPADWLLENLLVFLFVICIASLWRWFVFSRASMTLIFLFFCLHEIGAHYTYSHVPYEEWIKAITGYSVTDSMGWQRNHYDRAIHFAFGLLLAYPIREVLLRIVHVRGFWGYFLPFNLTLTFSLTYELIEWGAAELLGGDLGIAYLGTQGDVWDTQKDMLLAVLGALLAMLITATSNACLQTDFAEEWVDSLRVKCRLPLSGAPKTQPPVRKRTPVRGK
jgi:putative membrane protein